MKIERIGFLFCFLLFFCFSCSTQNLKISFTKEGNTNLTYKDLDLIIDTKPEVKEIVFEKIEKNENGERVYNFEKFNEKPVSVEWKDKERTLIYNYNWGTVSFQYNQKVNNLDINVKFSNKSDKTIANFNIGILNFFFT